MPLVFLGLCLVTTLELICWSKLLWPYRRLWSPVLITLSVAFYLCMMFVIPGIASGLIVFFGIYRVINVLRIYRGKTNPEFLYHVAFNTFLWLSLLQFIVISGQLLSVEYEISPDFLLGSVIAIGSIASLALFVSSLRNIKTTRPQSSINLPDKELPSITVAIPARDETRDLQLCLDSLTTSTYPKLEIIVLDDRSQDKRTPEIIRSYAQSGVRFLAGEEPPNKWLAKNFAYQQLSDAANGEYILYCGVDTRFQTDTLTKMVSLLMMKQKSMVSFLPKNTLNTTSFFWPFIVQPARYAWELSLPRRVLNRPPVLSTAWLINRELLRTSGSFNAIRHSHSPESHFAKASISRADGYSFVRDGGILGFASEKSLEQQKQTALRTRYPQLHRRPEQAALITIAEFGVLILPYVMLPIALFSGTPWLGLTGIPALILSVNYFTITKLTYQKTYFRSLFLHPLSAIYDVWLLNYSMLKYEFGTVIWKDRNIAEPIMRRY